MLVIESRGNFRLLCKMFHFLRIYLFCNKRLHILAFSLISWKVIVVNDIYVVNYGRVIPEVEVISNNLQA